MGNRIGKVHTHGAYILECRDKYVRKYQVIDKAIKREKVVMRYSDWVATLDRMVEEGLAELG